MRPQHWLYTIPLRLRSLSPPPPSSFSTPFPPCKGSEKTQQIMWTSARNSSEAFSKLVRLPSKRSNSPSPLQWAAGPHGMRQPEKMEESENYFLGGLLLSGGDSLLGSSTC